MIDFQAHKGVSTENPENTIPAFKAAIEQGYNIIELDVSVTKDMKFVLLHDSTINRTARNDDGTEISEQIEIGKITYAEAMGYDFGVAFSEKFRGTRIPLFEDVLKLAFENGTYLKIDNKYQRFNSEQREAFFKLIKPYETTACLTCSDVDEIKRAVDFFPLMCFHYDGVVTKEKLEQLSKIVPKNRLTVWMPYKNPSTSWVNVPFADSETAGLIKNYARFGIWILSKYSELEDADGLGADVIETNGQIKPENNKNIIADMHTHSVNSHDSVCEIEDMCLMQINRGTNIFAVTDHCDVFLHKDYDIYTPIRNSADTVRTLNEKYADKCLILSGVEISEGFWFNREYEKIHNLLAYDVIIGSVHCVKYKELEKPYSGIDFSKFTSEQIYHYLDCYFNDIITMLNTTDFDILAHLTCPLRYISGKYGINIDLSIFDDKITEILKTIIIKRIALEVNTSSYSCLGESMPDSKILKKYFDMGGYLLTIGSDAHIAQNASYCFDKAIENLKEIGFKNIFYYKERKAYQITI